MTDVPEHITVYDGKYTLIMDPTNMRALRYGEPWRDLVGDGFVMALGQEISDLRVKLAEAHAAILRGDTIASEFSEGCMEEARQASAEGDKKSDAEWCGRAAGFDKISNTMQPVLGLALREQRAAFLKAGAAAAARPVTGAQP